MNARVFAVSIPLIVAAAAYGQAGENRGGVIVPPNYGLRAPVNQGLPAAAPGNVRTAAPRALNPGGVRAVTPEPIPVGDQTRATIPFTRLGPTSRTIFEAERERAQQEARERGRVQDRGVQVRPRPLTPAERLHFVQQQELVRRGLDRRSSESRPAALLDVRPLDVHPRQSSQAELDRRAVNPFDGSALQQDALSRGPMPLQPAPGLDSAPGFEHNLQGPLSAGFVVRNRSGRIIEAPWWYGAAQTDWHRVPTWGIAATGTGFYAHSVYNDGKFRFRLRSGSPLIKYPRGYCPTGVCGTRACAGGTCGTVVCSHCAGGWSPTIYGSYLSVNEPSVMVDPQLVAAPEPEAEPVVYATEAERGEALLRAGEARRAAIVLRDYLNSNPHDARAMRSMGLAMIATNQVRDGIAVVGLAYQNDPALAADAVELDTFGTAANLRKVLERVSVYANRANMPSAWLTLAALMQAENRNHLASRMVERARSAGLEQEVAAQMLAALRF